MHARETWTTRSSICGRPWRTATSTSTTCTKTRNSRRCGPINASKNLWLSGRSRFRDLAFRSLAKERRDFQIVRVVADIDAAAHRFNRFSYNVLPQKHLFHWFGMPPNFRFLVKIIGNIRHDLLMVLRRFQIYGPDRPRRRRNPGLDDRLNLRCDLVGRANAA